MKITIKIDTKNDAFQGGNNGGETARILRELADRISNEQLSRHSNRNLRDVNGNVVGTFTCG